MKRGKCRYCGSKPRIQYMVAYRGIEMCFDCSCEYARIFDGWRTSKQRKGENKVNNKNPIFDAFKQGWEAEEQENGWPVKDIPQYLKDAYDKLWQTETDRWEQAKIDTRFSKGEDGISENQ